MVNITSYQSRGRIVKRGRAIDVGGRTGRRGINPVIYGFAVLNIDRLHLRDENSYFQSQKQCTHFDLSVDMFLATTDKQFYA